VCFVVCKIILKLEYTILTTIYFTGAENTDKLFGRELRMEHTLQSQRMKCNSMGMLLQVSDPAYGMLLQVFIWLMLQNRIWTSDRLQQRGWPNDYFCPFYHCNLETSCHLFQSCPITRQVWISIGC
jgi:hypothetical protein